jgi:hypothetical protein
MRHSFSRFRARDSKCLVDRHQGTEQRGRRAFYFGGGPTSRPVRRSISDFVPITSRRTTPSATSYCVLAEPRTRSEVVREQSLAGADEQAARFRDDEHARKKALGARLVLLRDDQERPRVALPDLDAAERSLAAREIELIDERCMPARLDVGGRQSVVADPQ